jgi:Cu2+-exporting ATPase
MLSHTEGVVAADVNYANHSVALIYKPSVVALPALDKVLQAVGYGLILQEEEEVAMEQQEQAQAQYYERLKRRTLWAGVLTFPVFMLGMFWMDMPYANYLMFALTLPILLFFGRDFFVNAFRLARYRQANMDTLVALSTGIAFLFSTFTTFYPQFWHERGLHAHVYFEAAAVILFFVLLGKLLEEGAKSNTTEALKKLLELQPKTVRVVREGVEQEISVKEVVVGDEVILRANEKIPVDGLVLSGHSYVDESLMTGEPIPNEKQAGSRLLAGTLNQQGSLRFVAERVGHRTVLSQLIKSVKEAQGSKAPVQKLVDKIAAIFVPTVLAIALVTFVAWMLLGGENALTHALLTSVSVLVIACPCALGLATPTAIMVGVGKGAEHQILVRDAESLERAQQVDWVILDKTGTLTEGKPEVVAWIWAENTRDPEAHTVAIQAIEGLSEHPLAEAVVRYQAQEGSSKAAPPVQHFRSEVGRGVAASVGERSYVIGTLAFLRQEDVHTAPDLMVQAEVHLKQAHTLVAVGCNGQQVALLAIADPIKPSAGEAVAQLHRKGIQVAMLTGDTLPTAEAVARQVGISHYLAEQKPADKMNYVAALQAQGHTVAMVGDGVNDSQALALADLSVAMGKGADIARDVAKMTLMSSDLLLLPKALYLSKRTVATIRQNLFWAFIYNLIGIPVAAGVLYPFNGFLLNPMLAGAAMALSSVSVVSNSLRLRRLKL